MKRNSGKFWSNLSPKARLELQKLMFAVDEVGLHQADAIAHIRRNFIAEVE